MSLPDNTKISWDQVDKDLEEYLKFKVKFRTYPRFESDGLWHCKIYFITYSKFLNDVDNPSWEHKMSLPGETKVSHDQVDKDLSF